MTEQADQRRRDAEVSRQIFGAVVEQRDDGTFMASIDPAAEETWIELPYYTTDVNTALQIIPAIQERGIEFCRLNYDAGIVTIGFGLPGGKYYSASHESFAEALCQAGLGAMAAVSKPAIAGSWCDSLRSSA